MSPISPSKMASNSMQTLRHLDKHPLFIYCPHLDIWDPELLSYTLSQCYGSATMSRAVRALDEPAFIVTHKLRQLIQDSGAEFQDVCELRFLFISRIYWICHIVGLKSQGYFCLLNESEKLEVI